MIINNIILIFFKLQTAIFLVCWFFATASFVLFGNSFQERKELEAEARRLNVPVLIASDTASLEKLQIGQQAFVISQDGKYFELTEKRSVSSILTSIFGNIAASLICGLGFYAAVYLTLENGNAAIITGGLTSYITSKLLMTKVSRIATAPGFVVKYSGRFNKI